jgi:GAF domain-containing protein
LRWPGVEQGAFGVISNRTGASIAVAAMDTHKSIAVTDAPKDQRYGSLIDGSVFTGTPLLAVPLRGRGNAVIGVVLIARGAGSSPFATEDIAAAEMVATLGSLSLYWCDGLTSGKNYLIISLFLLLIILITIIST